MLKRIKALLLLGGLVTAITFFLSPAATPSKEEKPSSSFIRGSVPLFSKAEGRGASGCPISPTTLLTAAHVWENTEKAGDLRVVLLDSIEVKTPLVGKIWLKHDKDIALLRILEDDIRFSFWNVLKKRIPSIGEAVKMSISNPSVEKGMVFGRMAFVDEDDGFLLFDMSAFPGTSGSCIFDEENNVVAIMSGVWMMNKEMPQRPFAKAVSVKEVK